MTPEPNPNVPMTATALVSVVHVAHTFRLDVQGIGHVFHASHIVCDGLMSVVGARLRRRGGRIDCLAQ
jgi:hypothetical protein